MAKQLRFYFAYCVGEGHSAFDVAFAGVFSHPSAASLVSTDAAAYTVPTGPSLPYPPLGVSVCATPCPSRASTFAKTKSISNPNSQTRNFSFYDIVLDCMRLMKKKNKLVLRCPISLNVGLNVSLSQPNKFSRPASTPSLVLTTVPAIGPTTNTPSRISTSNTRSCSYWSKPCPNYTLHPGDNGERLYWKAPVPGGPGPFCDGNYTVGSWCPSEGVTT